MARKLGMPADQRKAMLRNQVSNLLWYGRIETTLAAAKEVRSIAEKLITLAMRSYKDTVEVTKSVRSTDKKGNIVKVDKVIINDGAARLAARRRLMSELYDLKELKGEKESKSAYRERTRDVNHPLVEKMFNDLAPKYAKRAEESGQGGGYTRIMKLGPRRGDASEMAIIELV